MSNKAIYIIVGIFVAITLLAGSFMGGLVVGWMTGDVVAEKTTTATAQPATPEEMRALFAPFWEVWDLVHQEYVDQPVDDLLLMRGAIQGMLTSLGDKHTSYMDPDEFKSANEPLNGEYEGIGAWVDTTADYLTIISTMPGTPAEEAGLKPKDKIIGVNGEDVTGTPPDIVLKSVKGPANTPVVLTILREGEEKPFDVSITREKIIVKSVEYKMLDNQIAYIQLVTFGDKTTEELKAALKELMAQEPVGLILDLRGNGGGYLVTAVEVMSQFIKEGVVMYEEYGDGTRIDYESIPGGLATDIPMVVLVDEGSASASEITAGAIQDYGRAPLVGVTTYGKGSVQNWIALDSDGGAVRITVARWLTPKERQINGIGLTPDVVVELTDEDVQAERDPQLDKAIEILTGQTP